MYRVDVDVDVDEWLGPGRLEPYHPPAGRGEQEPGEPRVASGGSRPGPLLVKIPTGPRELSHKRDYLFLRGGLRFVYTFRLAISVSVSPGH